MEISLSELSKVKGIGKKTIKRIREYKLADEGYISEYNEDLHLDRNSVNQGDCLELMNGIPDKSVDMILADLPYGTTQCSWDSVIDLNKLWMQYKRIIKPEGVIVLTANFLFAVELYKSNLEWFKYDLVWNKKHGKAPGVAKYRPMPSHEFVLVFGEGTNTYNPQMEEGEPYVDVRKSGRSYVNGNEHNLGFKNEDYEMVNEGERYPLSVLDFLSYGVEGQHPTQKPLNLFEYLVKTYTNEGDLVLDNVAGSGTTGVACQNTDRDYILIEQEQKYVDIIRDRLEGDE